MRTLGLGPDSQSRVFYSCVLNKRQINGVVSNSAVMKSTKSPPNLSFAVRLKKPAWNSWVECKVQAYGTLVLHSDDR